MPVFTSSESSFGADEMGSVSAFTTVGSAFTTVGSSDIARTVMCLRGSSELRCPRAMQEARCEELRTVGMTLKETCVRTKEGRLAASDNRFDNRSGDLD